ncbi:GatB/YqeY domain-containing protein [Labilibaculum euxinus]|uniref:GatB/YqeY domain-containing protein n=1 Tax=Labilibaculum euxinus TaxID=2686357 RepID=A0A7M4DA92_9BACT|nr:GatB/YqeY domain-containing protein [Labilibaculum euxinus]MUP39571.1 GatB/YqeY domain-containing protein [Labilibaculum euxinus]MVB08776.1 GatB/YqeY domain-containing protein [Labilibaculum euxinus]
MGLLEQINSDIKTAMKAKERDRLEALRAVKTAFTMEMTKTGAADIDNDSALKIIQRLVKQRKDSASTFTAGGREDLAEKELLELSYLEVYLPAQLSDEDLTVAVQGIITKTGASSMKDMGKVMGLASKELTGKADGKAIADKVKELLS